jgi:hypothetical protein
MRTRAEEQNNPSVEGRVKAPRKRGSGAEDMVKRHLAELPELELAERVLARFGRSSRLAETAPNLSRTELPVDKSTEAGSEVETEERGSSAQERQIDLVRWLRGASHEELVVFGYTALDAGLSSDIDTLLDRIDQGIGAERVAMDRLIERMVSRAPR